MFAQSWFPCSSLPLSHGSARALGADPDLLPDLDALLQDAVATRQTQSAVLLVLRRGKVLYHGTAGPTQKDSLFDVASLTKVVATAPAIMHLIQEKKLSLNAKAARYLTPLSTPDKKNITVEQLLLHTSGLPSEVWGKGAQDNKDVILARIKKAKMKAAPGESYRYSDIGYILLGELVSKLAKEPFETYIQKKIFSPLGMCHTNFNPPAQLLLRTISPWPNGIKAGQVYDPLAARMKGIAGHAGLYSTAEDLGRLGQMMLDYGMAQGRRIMAKSIVERMLGPRPLPGRTIEARGLGWDISSPHAQSCKGSLSPRAFGHTGFTGTSLWIDPEHELVVVLLTNRTYFDPAPSVNSLRQRVHDTLVTGLHQKPKPPVATGLDQLVKSHFAMLRGHRVGLITNRTAIDLQGRWMVDLIANAPKVQLQALFVPEHGLEAQLDQHIKDGQLQLKTRRIPIYSLFGSRRRPSVTMLADLDTLVFDMQTVGVRYYTYLATMGWAMEEAAQYHLQFVVLDRPNPLGGHWVQGPVSDIHRRTSTNYHPLPVRYGMTLGELARLFNGERHLKTQLKVVPLRGWKREMLFPETGLAWINPSPNIRSWRQSLLYAGVGLLETTNVSVGRGTTTPFQLIGAPWMDSATLVEQMNRFALKGIHFVPTAFTPSAKPYKNELCHGIRLIVTEPRKLDPVQMGITLAVILRQQYPQQWKTKELFRLINHPPTTQAILDGRTVDEILALWSTRLKQFMRIRSRYLLY